jgi:serine/threonine protein phosphatase PrpC
LVSIEVAAAGHIGQDRAAAISRRDGYLLLLADGAGGTSGGATAADAVVARLSSMTLGSGPDCAELLKQLDRELDGVGETTAVVALVVGGSVFGASVGDSGAWLLGPDGVIDLTAAQKPKPLLGSGRAIPLVFGPFSFSHARILLGSDGLFKYVPHDLIREIASKTPLSETAAALVRAARLSGGALRDDVAVIVAG